MVAVAAERGLPMATVSSRQATTAQPEHRAVSRGAEEPIEGLDPRKTLLRIEALQRKMPGISQGRREDDLCFWGFPMILRS